MNMAYDDETKGQGKITSEDVIAYIKEWDKGKEWIDHFTRDFPELDSLADAVALSNTKNAPMVGDVTLATSVRQIPRASIQQVPTMSVEVNGTKMSIPAYVCEFLVRRMVFNQDTFGRGILSTMQMGAESALTHGFQADFASIGNIMNDFGATMKLIHYNDIVIEPGVFDTNDSSYFQVRTRVTRRQLKKIIRAAKENPETTWNVPALEELIKRDPTTESLSQYLTQPRDVAHAAQSSDTYDIITRYETGPYGDVCVFSTALEEPLRHDESNSKFGYPRVSFLVIDPAQLTPFGISRVRLASPTANYANIYLQSTAKMLLMNADPPVFQRGQFTTPIRMKRGALWQTADPNAEAKLQELSNSTLNQFQQVLEFVDNQIYAIMGVTPGTVGSGNTSDNYSKTAAGVKMEQQTRDMSTTQVTNIVEGHIRQYALTALDLFISEQVGQTPLIVDDKCKNAINDLMPDTIGDDNIIEINWEDFYAGIHTWTVDIDLSMADNELEDKKRADLQDMHTVMSQTANPNDPAAAARVAVLEKELLQASSPEIAKQTEKMEDAMGQPAMMSPGQPTPAPAPAPVQ
jgi:hypothetical protein